MHCYCVIKAYVGDKRAWIFMGRYEFKQSVFLSGAQVRWREPSCRVLEKQIKATSQNDSKVKPLVAYCNSGSKS